MEVVEVLRINEAAILIQPQVCLQAAFPRLRRKSGFISNIKNYHRESAPRPSGRSHIDSKHYSNRLAVHGAGHANLHGVGRETVLA